MISPLRCIRIPPGVGVRTIANVPLRKGEVDQDFDQDELAALLDQTPFNMAIADLYRVRFKDVPGVVYAAGVQHAYHVAEAFRAVGIKAKGVSGETPKRSLTRIPRVRVGRIDVRVTPICPEAGTRRARPSHAPARTARADYRSASGRVTRLTPARSRGS